jgi:hypothetical protein
VSIFDAPDAITPKMAVRDVIAHLDAKMVFWLPRGAIELGLKKSMVDYMLSELAALKKELAALPPDTTYAQATKIRNARNAEINAIKTNPPDEFDDGCYGYVEDSMDHSTDSSGNPSIKLWGICVCGWKGTEFHNTENGGTHAWNELQAHIEQSEASTAAP